MRRTPPLMDRPQGKQDRQATVRINAVRTTVLDPGECVGSSNSISGVDGADKK